MIAVDVGHYPAEPGVIGASGTPELEYNRALAYDVKAELERDGFQVRMIEDEPNLGRRARIAEGAALFVSIHHDSVQRHLLPRASEFSGFSLFVSRFNPQVDKSLVCASAIGKAMRAAGQAPSRYHADPVLGENRAFADEPNGVHYFDRLAVASSARLPALLVEAGVVINAAEEKRVTEPAERRRIAQAIARGVQECMR